MTIIHVKKTLEFAIISIVFLVDFVCCTPIVGGEIPAVDNYGQLKFAVSLQLIANSTVEGSSPTEPTHFCGGTFLNKNNWLLTASHCVLPIYSAASDIEVVIGEPNVKHGGKGRRYKVLEIVSKKYNPATFYNDIALIKIDTSINDGPSIADTIELPNEPIENSIGLYDECFIFGYGSSEFNGTPTLELRLGKSDIITQEQCEEKMGKYMAPERNSGMFCAQGHASDNIVVDACQGDSGGSLVCKNGTTYTTVGIISYGAGCGAPDMPGVYTSVQSHLEWINDIVNKQ